MSYVQMKKWPNKLYIAKYIIPILSLSESSIKHLNPRSHRFLWPNFLKPTYFVKEMPDIMHLQIKN